MSEPADLNPTSRFTGLADIYARHRPDYPAAALAHIVQRCELRYDSLVVDVGCGTGISARQFAQLGLRVIGIEPNADMRRQAEAVAVPPGTAGPVYREGTAETTGLGDATADLVLAAQAFHWFVADAALREFRRILKPGAWAALVWNERDESERFTGAYGDLVRSHCQAAEVEGSRQRSGEPLLVSPYFQHAERAVFGHEQVVDAEGLIGRAMSVSYAPREPERAAEFQAALRDVFGRFQHAGQVVMRYQTTVISAQRRD
jgi:ubiquinone/menaquinone biosynthesis C-methylase UbiE